ncbi:hypothetical protein PT286_00445 [Neisseriaceae bacterium ESL0693]|nr:hypothetical protein [Neisseriaceae bacterium ESL0693]
MQNIPKYNNTYDPQTEEWGQKSIIDVTTSTYDFSIGEIIEEGWQCVSGSKLAFFLALLILIGSQSILTAFAESFIAPDNFVFSILFNIISSLIINMLSLGFMSLTLRYLNDSGSDFLADFFAPWKRLFAFCWAYLLLAAVIIAVSAIIMVVMLILVYLLHLNADLAFTLGMLLIMVAVMIIALLCYLTPWIIMDYQGITVCSAIYTSYVAIKQHWFKIGLLMSLLALINVATVFTLGIGLIWSIPLTNLTIGCLYKHIFYHN